MKYFSGLLTGLVVGVALAGGAFLGWRMLVSKPGEVAKVPPPPVPATVSKVLKEEAITTVVLKDEGEKALAIQLGKVERKPTPRVRVYGGEIAIPAGSTFIVSAPLAGTLKAVPAGMPVPGQSVKRGQPMLELLPILTPEGRANLASAKVDAEGQVQNARTSVMAAKIALDRATQLLKSDAGSKRMVDEAQAAYDLAMKTLQAVTARFELLEKVVGDVEKGTSAPVFVESPEDGMLRNVSASPGQSVFGGAALFEIVKLDKVWVRVPVYVGDISDLDPAAEALVANLSAKPGASNLPAIPYAAPPSANPLAGTVDLFYELDNRKAKYSPGERVGVSVHLKGEAESLTVPWAAVLHDIHGGTWVYEKTGDKTYTRKRVNVRFVDGAVAVLANGPPPGTVVVTAGAAELFGTETGFSK